MTPLDIEPDPEDIARSRRVTASLRRGRHEQDHLALKTDEDYRLAVGRLMVRLQAVQEDCQRQIDDLQARVAALEAERGLSAGIDWDRP